MGYENVGPKMVFTLDGKILFFDEKNEQIPIRKKDELTQEEFIELINNNELQHSEMISVYSFVSTNGECKIVYWYDNVRVCYWVDCETHQFIRMCGPGD